jgi:FKBP12-rapamycin complex-associated protein
MRVSNLHSTLAHLASQVATIVAEMPADVVVKLWEDEITPRLADLIHSQNSWENFGGVSAIGV